MHTEYEVKVLEIDVDEVTKKLKKLNAKLVFDSLQQRYVYNLIPKVDGKWIRLRTNGDRTTLTLKNIVSSGIEGTKEIEIEVDDFEKTNSLLCEMGYSSFSFQENRRVQYIYNGVEIDIDYWPLIPTYMEIEGPNEEAVYQTLKELGFIISESTTSDVDSIYKDYGYDLNTIKELKLEDDRK